MRTMPLLCAEECQEKFPFSRRSKPAQYFIFKSAKRLTSLAYRKYHRTPLPFGGQPDGSSLPSSLIADVRWPRLLLVL